MKRFIGVIVFSVLALAALPALAQDGPAEFQQILHITIKPGMGAEFERIVQEYMDAAGKQDVANRWWMFQQGAGGTPNHFHLVSGFNQWADRDAWATPRDMFVGAHGEEQFADVSRRWNAVVADAHVNVGRFQPELSSKEMRSDGIAKHYLINRTEIRPEKAADYRLALQKIRAGQDEAQGSPSRVTRRLVEGNRYVYRTITGFDSGADRDRWPGFSEFMSIYSEEETEQVLDMLNGAIVNSTWFELTYRPDLSYTGPGGTTN